MAILQELQNLSEANKKKILVIATAIVMVIVVSVWLSYLNSIVTPSLTVEQQTATTTDSSAATAPGPGFLQGSRNFFSGIEHWFTNPSQYTIQPQ